MNRFVLSLIAGGMLLAGPTLAQTMASPGVPARGMVPGGMTAGSMGTGGMASGGMSAPVMTRPSARAGARAGAMPAAPMAPVNVNTATAAQLDAIPQIGLKRAQAIIAHRPYTVPSDMVTKKALSQGIFEKIKANVTTS
jgi:competence protein ComEA